METLLNIEKKNLVLFWSGGKLGKRDKWYYNDAELDIVTRFTFLGVVFSQNGSFSKTQQTLARQTQKAVFSMFRMTNKYVGLNPFPPQYPCWGSHEMALCKAWCHSVIVPHGVRTSHELDAVLLEIYWCDIPEPSGERDLQFIVNAEYSSVSSIES